MADDVTIVIAVGSFSAAVFSSGAYYNTRAAKQLLEKLHEKLENEHNKK